jgi:N-acetylmuramoyl-L-alanine amidase
MSQQVSEMIDRCDTGLTHGLSLQLIEKLNRMVKTPILVPVNHRLIDSSSSACNAWLQPLAAAALIAAVERRGQTLKLNSCLRTTVQQHIIRRQYESGSCGITAAALPGRSNHERGAAIDIEDPEDWQPALESAGWVKLGSWDNMHFDFWNTRRDLAGLQISAFQILWNANNPNHQITVDGCYGETTASKIDLSPVDGWQVLT